MITLKKSIALLPLLFLVFILASCGASIDTQKISTPTFSQESITVPNELDLSFSIIETGFTHSTEAFIYKGGSLFKKRRVSHISVLVKHPKANFVFDAGLGSDMQSQFKEHFSFIDRQTFKFTQVGTLKSILEENDFPIDSIKYIIPSHLHFDHASGIEDFPKAKILVTKEEYEHANSDEAEEPAFIKQQYDSASIQWGFIKMLPKPYEVFEQSLDLFKDGSIVLVPLYGHTKGSVGMFINLPSGERFFFTGDLTWAAEAFDAPSEKHPIPRAKVDNERDLVKQTIVKVHYLTKEKPEIKIVPAHDSNTQKDIAHFPEFEK